MAAVEADSQPEESDLQAEEAIVKDLAYWQTAVDDETVHVVNSRLKTGSEKQSVVWNHFRVIVDVHPDDEVPAQWKEVHGFVVCNHDQKVLLRNNTSTTQMFNYLTRHHFQMVKNMENEDEKSQILKKGKKGIAKSVKRKAENQDIRNMFQPLKKRRLTKIEKIKQHPFTDVPTEEEKRLKEFTTDSLLSKHINSNFGKYHDVEKKSFVSFLQDFVDIGASHGRVDIEKHLLGRRALTDRNAKNYDEKLEKKKKRLKKSVQNEECHIESDIWKNEATQEYFIGVNAVHWENDWESKKWGWTCTALGMDQIEATLNLNSSNAEVQAHTAENLEKLVLQILEFWGN